MCNYLKHFSDEESSVFIITDFSEEIKNSIRENLSKICYGNSIVSIRPTLHPYKKTVKEFMKRYKDKPETTQKGMIGELLAHVLLLMFKDDLSPIGLYFNMEERSITKGFDILYINGDRELWITEVKSGELGQERCSNSKNRVLVNKAKIDLVHRLNDDELGIWNNALNGALVAMNENDTKVSVVNILADIQEHDDFTSDNKNVILCSVLYNSVFDEISHAKVKEHKSKIDEGKLFNKSFVVCIQKNTYQAVEQFLRSEICNEENDITTT